MKSKYSPRITRMARILLTQKNIKIFEDMRIDFLALISVIRDIRGSACADPPRRKKFPSGMSKILLPE